LDTTFGGFTYRYSAAFKIRIAKAYLGGGVGHKALAGKHGIDFAKVRLWAKLYKAHGTRGLARKYSYYSAKFKLAVLRRMWADGLSYYDTAAIFNIRTPSWLATWERLYREGGIRALEPGKRGRPKAVTDPKETPSRRSDAERSPEELIAELNQLRMENAYLKKLDALVRARRPPKGRK
jgi:transposase